MDVAAGMDFSCGIRDAGETVVCFGPEGSPMEQTPEDGGPWARVSSHAGAQHACVLAQDDEGDGAPITCWGNDERGQLDVPAAE